MPRAIVLAAAVLGMAVVARPASRAPWDTLSPTTSPKAFFPGTVSRKGVVHFNSSFSDDGSLLAYTVTGSDAHSGKGFPSQTAAGVLYFACMPEGTRDSDIYRVAPTPDGYAEPERLPAPINTARFEGDAFVDRQERFLIFAGFDRPGSQGESDLYITRRCADGWTEPRNLGPVVNSSGFDGSPFVTPDDRP